MPKNLVVCFLILFCLFGCNSSQVPSKQIGRQEESERDKTDISIIAKQAGNVEAAARYLDIVCPANREIESQEANEKRNVDLVNRGELTNQDYGRLLDESLLVGAANAAQSAKAMTDPGFIWPENIRSLVAEMAAAQMEIASSSREFVRIGGYTAASQQNLPLPDSPFLDASQRKQEKASAIRSALRLPPRNEGCSNGQRALTTDQIKTLQQN
jgi:hypothetical protein